MERRSSGSRLDRVRDVARRYAPESIKRAARRSRWLASAPPVGRVRFGDLRRTTPVASDFGYRRGGPVDRHYIEGFLEQHRADVRGRVLEVGDSEYTRRYGEERVIVADVLHVDPDADEATFVGDLADGLFLPDDTFDCIILTQTLHLIYDFAAALRTVSRVLAPGGVLLMTVPGITNIDADEWGSTWHYSFSPHSVRRMCADAFDGFDVAVTSHGNVLAAVAFLHGLGSGELTAAELDTRHVEYSLIHAARVQKPDTSG
jgi:SAM-dependent methyltransferase